MQHAEFFMTNSLSSLQGMFVRWFASGRFCATTHSHVPSDSDDASSNIVVDADVGCNADVTLLDAFFASIVLIEEP